MEVFSTVLLLHNVTVEVVDKPWCVTRISLNYMDYLKANFSETISYNTLIFILQMQWKRIEASS